jgi:hypothetical protein
MGEVRAACYRPPAHPRESPSIFRSGVSDEAAWRAYTSRAWFEGARAWHQHFYAKPGAAAGGGA